MAADDPHVCCEGAVGWVAGRPVVKLPDGTHMPVRLATVLKKEQRLEDRAMALFYRGLERGYDWRNPHDIISFLGFLS